MQQLRVAARESQARIRRDRKALAEDLKPLLSFTSKHLFERTFNVARLREISPSGEYTIQRLRLALKTSPQAYIEERRMETACHLLDETTLKVWEISEWLGYSRVQVFSRAFIRCSGRRPTQYRRRHQVTSIDTAAAAKLLKRRLTRLNPPISDEEIEAIRSEEIWQVLQTRSLPAQLELLSKIRPESPSLLILKATVLRDQRLFPEALVVVDEALGLTAGQRQLHAKAMILKASILSLDGDPAGILLLEQALAFGREPEPS